MALEPDRALPSATTGRDGGNGPRGSAEDGVQQVQRDDRVKAHKRRLAVENAAFLELAEMLPVRSSTSGFVDKPTVLRHAIALMKVSRFYRRDLPQPPRSCGASQWETTETLTDALSGFVFMLDGNGWILYMSDSVSKHLGHSAVEMMGNNIRNYLHDDDMAVLSNLLRLPVRGLTDRGEPCQMLLRVTNSLRKWRPSCKSGCGRYAVVLCCGYRRFCQLTETPISEDNRSSNILLLATGYTLPHSYLSQCELETGSGMPVRSSLTFLGQRCFMFRSSLGLTPFYVEAAVKELTGYETFTFSRSSLYHFVHPCDIESVRRSHNDVLAKGHSVTGYYRLIVRSGGWIWMQSYFSLVHAASTTRKKFILAVNYAISGVENSRLGSHDVSYPNHFLSLRKGPGISDRGKAMELCRREGKTPMTSTPKNVKCYGNSDQNAILGSAGSAQNNDHNTALAYSCAHSNFMKSLAARESVRNEQTHTLWSQPQREADGIRSNASAGRVSVNTAGLSGGTVHQNLLGPPQKLVRRDGCRKFARHIGRIPGPQDWRLQRLQHQPMQSLTLKFISEATPFTDDDSNATNNLMFDTGLLSGRYGFRDRGRIQTTSLTPAQNHNTVVDTYQQFQWTNSFATPRLPAREDLTLRQVPKLPCRTGNALMGRGSSQVVPSCRDTRNRALLPAQPLNSETIYPQQAEDSSSGSLTGSTRKAPGSSCRFQSGF